MWIQTFCSYPFTRARITCEGNISMCCFMRENPLLPKEKAYIGNVLEDNFDNIWHGELAEEIRSHTNDGRLHEMCSQNPGCPFVGMNRPYPKEDVVYNEYPTFLEIDLPNTHCNIGGLKPNPETSPACIMCERSAPHFRPEDSSRFFEVLSRIKHILPNLHQIHIQGIAEPFYQTNQEQESYMLFDMLDKLEYEKYKDQITISVTTNATLFKPSVRKEYLERCPKSITNFSIDAATPETFKAIRIFNCFEKVLENMYAFDRERTRDRQFLRIHNNINIMNVHEVVGMVRIAAKARAEYVEFNPTDGFNHKILVNDTNCGKFAKAQQDIIEECDRLGISYKFLRPLDLGLTNQLVQLTI